MSIPFALSLATAFTAARLYAAAKGLTRVRVVAGVVMLDSVTAAWLDAYGAPHVVAYLVGAIALLGLDAWLYVRLRPRPYTGPAALHPNGPLPPIPPADASTPWHAHEDAELDPHPRPRGRHRHRRSGSS